jgi:hypothetical protein
MTTGRKDAPYLELLEPLKRSAANLAAERNDYDRPSLEHWRAMPGGSCCRNSKLRYPRLMIASFMLSRPIAEEWDLPRTVSHHL